VAKIFFFLLLVVRWLLIFLSAVWPWPTFASPILWLDWLPVLCQLFGMILKDARRSRWSLCNFSAASLQKDFDTGGMTTEASLLIKICLAWLLAKSLTHCKSASIRINNNRIYVDDLILLLLVTYDTENMLFFSFFLMQPFSNVIPSISSSFVCYCSLV
jgi:hypothetical protein